MIMNPSACGIGYVAIVSDFGLRYRYVLHYVNVASISCSFAEAAPNVKTHAPSVKKHKHKKVLVSEMHV